MITSILAWVYTEALGFPYLAANIFTILVGDDVSDLQIALKIERRKTWSMLSKPIPMSWVDINNIFRSYEIRRKLENQTENEKGG